MNKYDRVGAIMRAGAAYYRLRGEDMAVLVKKRKTKFAALLPAALTLAVLAFPSLAANGAARGLRLCGTLVVSLLPFMTLSAWASGAGAFSGGRLTGKLTRTLFALPPSAANAILSGWLCGYPAGARAAAREYEAGALTKAQAERLLTFCVCVSPSFAVSAVGVSLFGSAWAGFCIYAGAALSCLLIGVSGRFFAKKEPPRKAAVKTGSGFAEAVADGAESMLKICALTVLFGAFIGVAEGTALNGLSARASAAVKLALELANGSAAASACGGFALCAAGAGFGGLCALCQCAALTRTEGERLNVAPMLLSRIVHGALTAFFASLLLRLDGRAVGAFSTLTDGVRAVPKVDNIPAAVVLLMLSATVLMKSHAKREGM